MAGKVALITGATSGIGKETAILMARRGYRVKMIGLNDAAGSELAAALNKEGRPAKFYRVDVTDEGAVAGTVAEIQHEEGRIDALVHSAGMARHKRFLEMSYAEWLETLEQNLHGTFLVVRAVAPIMAAQKSGKIVLISSGSVLSGSGAGAHYLASKAGQIGLMRSLAMELAPYNINVNAIGPRSIGTRMLSIVYSADQEAALAAKIPLGRIGTAQDVANLALFLASEESSYITGQFILVDGGRTCS